MATRDQLHEGQEVFYHSIFFLDGKPRPGYVRKVRRTLVEISRYPDSSPGVDFRIDTQKRNDPYQNSWFELIDE